MTEDIYAWRVENLRALQERYGGQTELAIKLGHANGSYLGQLCGPHPTRPISEKAARKIEKQLGEPAGLLDRPPKAKAVISDNTMADVVHAIALMASRLGVTLSPEKQADAFVLVYQHARDTGNIDEQFVQRVVKLAQ